MGARGPKPGTVKKPPGSGRTAGTMNKATADVKALASKYGPEVIAGFIRLFREADSDAARIAAGKELLDRAYGRATQPLSGDATMDAIRVALSVGFVGSDPRGS